jgi:hypothetical protein
MKSFFDDIKDSTLTWSSEDDISLSSSCSSSDFHSSDDEDDDSFHSDHGGDEVQEDVWDRIENHGQHGEGGNLLPAERREQANGNHEGAAAIAAAVAAAVDDFIPQHAQQRGENEARPQAAGSEGVNRPENQPIQPPLQQQRQRQEPAIRNPPSQPIRRNATQILRNIEMHPRSNELLFRIARCEVLPLIRAEIDWGLLQKQLPTYPGAELSDDSAAFLLQSVLRMDPPLDIIRELIRIYPKSCVDMDPFYAACQYSSDDAVLVLLRRTMKARKQEGIHWSMLALLGDARIRLRHAKFLLQYNPEAVIDPSHGLFGVSPLDRMISGAFIHGDAEEWVNKLKLALLTADRGFVDDEPGSKPFYPFHALLNRLISHDFMGVQFGAFTFVNCLSACIDGDENHCPFHQVDQDGNLPIHLVLGQECKTNLGIIGERKLVKFLLHANPSSATTPNAKGVMPIRLAIENGWPLYDIIARRCPIEYVEGCASVVSQGDGNEPLKEFSNLLFHDILSGPYSDRFGIYGARKLVRFILEKFPMVGELTNARGRYPIHLAIENGWPCHDIIVGSAPFTLEIKDPISGMYPFQVAACANCRKLDVRESGGSKQLSTLYELIRECPLLIEGFGSGEMNPRAPKRRSSSNLSKDHEGKKKKRRGSKRSNRSSSGSK